MQRRNLLPIIEGESEAIRMRWTQAGTRQTEAALELRLLRYFVAVEAALHFARAAGVA